MRLDFQPRELTTSRWLLQEMKKAGWWLPCIRTTGGWRSKPLGSSVSAFRTTSVFRSEAGRVCICTVAAGCVFSAAADCGFVAADHAAGLEIPALTSAAAVFGCLVMAAAGL